MQAILALEDGRIFRGEGYGHPGECQGEVVFNTSLTGYQEIATDPSYAGQIVVLTNPQIGNYGTNQADNEASKPFIEGLIVREFSPISSNWRSEQVTDEYMERFQVPVLAEIDTRALVRHLRNNGVMRGVISTLSTDAEALVQKARKIRKMDGTDLAKVVSTKAIYHFDENDPRYQAGDPLLPSMVDAAPLHVVAYDFGIKQNILRMLARENCKVTVVPAQTSAEDVLALKPNGVFLSNGPGDPEPVDYAVKAIRGMMGRVPVFGICLGHQLCGLALGGKTYKLKFGHHGGNHPVRNNVTGKVEITAHNHNFAVDPDSVNANEVELTHVDLNDNTLEGLRHKSLPLFSVQYHPEAAPGPHDSHYLFRDFRQMMEEWKG
ncbi:glutamine-hydrolyzing carbamoyl-phosphate synthase small subunit [Occallatibacter riparius]|uniref:Carbamoyl phosphate synthase small chain n=1 Tax=Occallatibacter riparius TaxID=1002689 RepID=A0A9J7BJR4_9BACT|nr:glutamine-hydrolyzing carbamoyl-phosphate synthase small subunit [Occallatibacter riparius]UWZ83064.1 glutamine-hydrolyzing carbamoyl-phosphate synthase small subunit [Occallatibacter riparius]